MAAKSIRPRLIFALSAALLAGSAVLTAQLTVSIEEAARRNQRDFAPLLEHQEVTVSGIVGTSAVRVLAYAHVGIHDGGGNAITLDGQPEIFAPISPGDTVQIAGVCGQRSGLPVIFVRNIRKTGHVTPLAPLTVKWNDLLSSRYLGFSVVTEGVVEESGENTGGHYLLLGKGSNLLKVFLPQGIVISGGGLRQYERGDRIQVTGLSSQFCPSPPYDRFFQVILDSPRGVVVLERSWLVPPRLIGSSILVLFVALGLWWMRERKMSMQRQAMRALNTLGEEILSASSPSEILEKLNAAVPSVLRITDVHLYIYRAGPKALERIAGRNAEAAMIPLESPAGSLVTAATLCFRNSTLLAVSDTIRSPLFRGNPQGTDPKSVMFVPMFAQNEPLGVLALCHANNPRTYNQDEQAAAQHFANQIATSLRLLEQRTMREQLFRSEKLAATGQLISGIVDELQSPLESVVLMAGRALARPVDVETKRQLAAIAFEARRASEIVSRLVSFARTEKYEAKPVELNTLLSSLIEFREREWAAREIQISDRLSMEPVYVLGSQGQLEQVFLNLMVHAEQSLADSEHRELYISTSLLARRVLVAISYSGPESAIRRDPFVDQHSPDAGALGLGVCRGIIQSHGGEIRFIRASGSGSRFEVELPVSQIRLGHAPGESLERNGRQFTILMVEPELAVQRQLLVQLSGHNCRVVPAPQPEEAAQLVERMKFDLVFCSVRLPGSNWLEFFERVRHHVGAFVLLTEGYDEDLARAFQTGEGFILRKPVDEKELASLLAGFELSAPKNLAG